MNNGKWSPDDGARLRRAREAAGLTTTEAGAKVGLSADSVRNHEAGRNAPDGPTLLVGYCRLYRVSWRKILNVRR